MHRFIDVNVFLNNSVTMIWGKKMESGIQYNPALENIFINDVETHGNMFNVLSAVPTILR